MPLHGFPEDDWDLLALSHVARPLFVRWTVLGSVEVVVMASGAGVEQSHLKRRVCFRVMFSPANLFIFRLRMQQVEKVIGGG